MRWKSNSRKKWATTKSVPRWPDLEHATVGVLFRGFDYTYR
jgi:hypothetical protein